VLLTTLSGEKPHPESADVEETDRDGGCLPGAAWPVNTDTQQAVRTDSAGASRSARYRETAARPADFRMSDLNAARRRVLERRRLFPREQRHHSGRPVTDNGELFHSEFMNRPARVGLYNRAFRASLRAAFVLFGSAWTRLSGHNNAHVSHFCFASHSCAPAVPSSLSRTLR